MICAIAAAAAAAALACTSTVRAAADPTIATFKPLHSIAPHAKLLVQWAVDREHETLVFHVRAETEGWVGVGLSPFGGMENADMVIGWVNADGSAVLSDRHSKTTMEPSVDASQDYRLLEHKLESGVTELLYERAWHTCDDEHDIEVFDGTERLIWSFSPVKPVLADAATQRYTLAKHSARGTVSVNLLNAPLPNMMTSDEAAHHEVLEVRMDKIAVPNQLDTYYMCRGYELPDELANQRQQGIAFEPLIDAANVDYVHHILLYECKDTVPAANLTWSGNCYGGEMPQALAECNFGKVLSIWAVGGNTFYTPAHVGLPFGSGHSGKWLMEVHYNNPNLDAGIVDSSGFGITYVKGEHLRPVDAGVLTVGTRVNPETLVAPPGHEYNITGFCDTACTKTFTEPITLFQSVLHTHLQGTGLFVRHFDESGVEQELLVADNAYDFNFQDGIRYWEDKVVKPGDSLSLTCRYNNKGTKPVVGGLATTDEMCLAYHFYYPAQDMAVCLSNIIPEYLIGGLDAAGVFDNLPTEEHKASAGFWKDNSDKIDWKTYSLDATTSSIHKTKDSNYRYCVDSSNTPLIAPQPDFAWPASFDQTAVHLESPSTRDCSVTTSTSTSTAAATTTTKSVSAAVRPTDDTSAASALVFNVAAVFALVLAATL